MRYCGFRVTYASRVLVSASRRNNLYKSSQWRGRHRQQARRVRYPEFLRATSLTEQLVLRAGGRLEPELAIRIRRRDATLCRAFDVTFHDQIWLVHFF